MNTAVFNYSWTLLGVKKIRLILLTIILINFLAVYDIGSLFDLELDELMISIFYLLLGVFVTPLSFLYSYNFYKSKSKESSFINYDVVTLDNYIKVFIVFHFFSIFINQALRY